MSWGNGKIGHGAFLDISAAFDKVWHKGLISKLEQIGISGYCLALFKSYLSHRKQCVVVDGVKSPFIDLQAGVPQGSRLGPLLFIIYINDIVEELECDILIFADDCSLLASGVDPTETANKLNRDLLRISTWADKWKVSFNSLKSRDMIFTNKMLNNSPPLIFKNDFIERVNTHRQLGVYLTSNLDWSFQINDICLKANRKLSVLRNVKMLKRKTLDLLYKIIVRSVIDYALPLYGNNLKKTDLARLERLQYRAAKLVTGTLHLTSKERLNQELGWESIKTRIDFLGLCLFQKIHAHETRPLIRSCLTKLDCDKKRVTRSKGGYLPYPNFGVKFLNSFFPYISKIWNNLDNKTKTLALPDFKIRLKNILKPDKIKHFSKGSKTGNIFLTRIRLDRSDLNLHKYSVGKSDSPECACHARQESSYHYMIDCFLYNCERQILYNSVEHYIKNFRNLGKRKQFEILTLGIDIKNPDYNYINTYITYAVQHYIFRTKRFSI